MNTFAKFGAAAAVALAAGAALAQDVAPAADQAEAEAAFEARHDLLEALGAEMDKISPMMRRQEPFDAAIIKGAADEMLVLTQDLPAAFAVDTRGFDLDTRARDAVWAGYDGFTDKSSELEVALVALQEAADAGDQGPTMRAVAAVGQACGSCHDAYRTDN